MIIKGNVTKQVVDYFIMEIRNENWKIGELIPSENELTEFLGVSRSSVRSAIKQFTGVQVLESVQGKGTYLRKNDLSIFGIKSGARTKEDYDEMIKLMEFRLVLEPECCALAISKVNETLVQKMQDCLEIMQNSIGNQRAFVNADLLFHEIIVNGTENQFLVNSLKDIFANKIQSFQLFNEVYGYVDGIYYHDLILKAFKEQDAQKAKRIMRSHLRKALGDLETSKMNEVEKAN